MAAKTQIPSPFIQYTGRGLKSFDFSPWGGIEGFLEMSKAGGGGAKAAQLKRVIPWLARAESMTSNAVAGLPFEILNEAGETVDSSDDWQNKVGGIPTPKRLLRLVAGSLCGGAAYVIPQRTDKLIIDMQYVAPRSIEPYIDINGLQYFDRANDQGKTERIQPDDIIYFWLPDSDVELGPALSHPLGTATMAADLLYSMDSTLATYGKRGFVPATILGAKGMPIAAEREKMEAWWDRFLRGWTSVVAKVFNVETLTLQRVGAGLEELKSVYQEITKQQIENIGSAFGIPAGMFMSDSAYASEMDNLTRQWYDTSEFKSIYHTIEETLTEQLLDQWGYRWVFRPETLDVYQEDEKQRAYAFATYVGAGFKRSIAAQMLGIELPEGVEYATLDEPTAAEQAAAEARERLAKQPEQQPIPAPEIFRPKKEPQEAKAITLTADEIKDLDLWCQVAKRNYRKGKGAAVDFECKALSEELASPIRDKLARVENELDIVKAFEIGTPVTDTPAPEYSRNDYAIMQLAESLNQHAEKGMQEPPMPIVLDTSGTDKILEGIKALVEKLETRETIVIPAPLVEVKAAEQPAPIVNVAPAAVTVENIVQPATVNLPRVKSTRSKVKRDAKERVDGQTVEYEYEGDA